MLLRNIVRYTVKKYRLMFKADFSIKKDDLPSRFRAFYPPVQAKPDQLNLTESTSAIYRLMSVAELEHILNTGLIGNDNNTLSKSNVLKINHLHVAEHVQENNSKILLSFSFNPIKAANYAGLAFVPNNYALVKTNLPPVYTVPGNHFDLDSDPFVAYHNLYAAHQFEIALKNGTKYITPVCAGTLAKNGQEVDMVINNLAGQCDFRPGKSEMLLQVNFLWGGLKNYTFVIKPAPIMITEEHVAQRDWAIEVLCPTADINYVKMLQTARDQKMIPPYSRPITVDDATVIFPMLKAEFPADVNIRHPHVHILKYVPEDLTIASADVGIFIHEEHAKFRKAHSLFNHGSSRCQHEYSESVRPSEDIRPRNWE